MLKHFRAFLHRNFHININFERMKKKKKHLSRLNGLTTKRLTHGRISHPDESNTAFGWSHSARHGNERNDSLLRSTRLDHTQEHKMLFLFACLFEGLFFIWLARHFRWSFHYNSLDCVFEESHIVVMT